MAFSRRRIPNDVVGYLAVINDVGTLLHFHRRDRGHRFDAIDVHLGQLLDEGEHRVQLALRARNLGLGDRDPGEMGDTANGGGGDGHYIWPLAAKFSPPYSRGGFCAATAGDARQLANWPSRARALPASARVSSAAAWSRRSRTACPAQRLVKSTLPSFSAAAFSGARLVAAWGKAGASGEIGPTSRITRLATPRAGRPVMTLVMTVESSSAWASAIRAGALTLDSGQRRWAVPICTPAAPSANAAAIPRPSAMPPAAMTGTFTASTICGTSAKVPGCSAILSVRNMPRWPPASAPCAMMTSAPFSSSQIASLTMVADDITMQPAALTRRTIAGSGRPK